MKRDKDMIFKKDRIMDNSEKDLLFYLNRIIFIFCILLVSILAAIFILRYMRTKNESFNMKLDQIKAQVHKDRYTLSFIKTHSDITAKDKYLFVEDRDINTGSTIYIETKDKDGDYSVIYNVSGYESGFFSIDHSYCGYIIFADNSAYYNIASEPLDCIMTDDKEMIKDICDIDYKTAWITDIFIAEDQTEKESGMKIEEDVVFLSDASYDYALYLDPKTGICKRLQAVRNENSVPVEEFYITIEDADDISIPQEITRFEQQDTLTGEEFAGLIDKYILGAVSIMVTDS